MTIHDDEPDFCYPGKNTKVKVIFGGKKKKGISMFLLFFLFFVKRRYLLIFVNRDCWGSNEIITTMITFKRNTIIEIRN